VPFSCRILFSVEEDRCDILAIIHSARDFAAALEEEGLL